MSSQAVTEAPVRSPGAPGALTRAPARAGWLRSPFLLACLACLALAALSAAILPTVPSYDPWSWIVWGRELVDPHLDFAVGGGPSWKPLPLFFTTVFGLFGGAAPTLWVIIARAGGFLGLVGAYRLAARLVREPGGAVRWAAPVAGVIAGAGVVLTQAWVYYMLRGTSEPILIGTSLWAVERHLAGRRGTAFALGVAASLIRPEAWPFVLVYAAWLWRGERRMRIPIALGLFAIPFFWFVPAWIGSGQPFLAASHAKDYNGHLGAHPLLEVLRRGTDIQILPMLILALVAVGLAAWRGGRLSGAAGAASGPPDGVSWRDRVLAWLPPPGGDRLTLALGACALAWWVIVVAMTLDGYPGLERFYLPAAAITCVLAGAGVVRLAALAGSRLARPGRLIPAAVVLLLVVASIPFATGRIDTARSQEPTAARAVTRLDQLSAAVAAVGGHRGVYPCRTSFAAVNHGVQTALAWKLHVTLGRVGTTMRHQGVMFVGPHDSIDGGPAAIDHRLTQIRLLAHVGAWRVYRVTSPGSSTRCVGG